MLPRRTGAISRPCQQTRRSMAQFRIRKLQCTRRAPAPGPGARREPPQAWTHPARALAARTPAARWRADAAHRELRDRRAVTALGRGLILRESAAHAGGCG